MSAHLPHADKPCADYNGYVQALEEVERQTIKNNQHCIIGVDANAVLGTYWQHDDPCSIGRHGIGMRSERERQIFCWVCAC